MREERMLDGDTYRPILCIDVDWTLTPDCGKTSLRSGATDAATRIRELAEVANLYIWSTGGKQYAEQVVAQLGLEDCICGCLGKPALLIDDTPIREWLVGGEALPEWEQLTPKAVLDRILHRSSRSA